MIKIYARVPKTDGKYGEVAVLLKRENCLLFQVGADTVMVAPSEKEVRKHFPNAQITQIQLEPRPCRVPGCPREARQYSQTCTAHLEQSKACMRKLRDLKSQVQEDMSD